MLLMLPVSLPYERTALLAAFISRFSLGFFAAVINLPMSRMAAGVLVGLLTSVAVGEDRAATVSGRHWHHRRSLPPAKKAEDPVFQDQLSAKLAEITGVSLF